MESNFLPENPYVLLTPGPLSTSKSVKAAMLGDWCTWDSDYNAIVQDIRSTLVSLASVNPGYTAVLMQGSGTFAVESAIGSAVPRNGKLLVLANGHYGVRMGLIAQVLGISCVVISFGELDRPDADQVSSALESDPEISHVAVVHCETTTGMINPVKEIGCAVKRQGRTYIVDAMSSFGGIPLDMAEIGADFLVSSANKCIQGVPGFAFVIAACDQMQKCRGQARSLSLDLFGQWEEMEKGKGKWRFTSPTHVVRAFAQALDELDREGGIMRRYARYRENHEVLLGGMEALGFRCLLPPEWQSPIITAFCSPVHHDYDFNLFYAGLKEQGFVIYPGKATSADTFRIGNIGHVFPEDMSRLVDAVKGAMYWSQPEGRAAGAASQVGRSLRGAEQCEGMDPAQQILKRWQTPGL